MIFGYLFYTTPPCPQVVFSSKGGLQFFSSRQDGVRHDTLRNTVIEYGTQSTLATSFRSNVSKELTVQETPKNLFTSLEKAGQTRQLPPGPFMWRHYANLYS